MSSLQSIDKSAVGLPTAEPEEVGFSGDRLARIGPSMQKYIDTGMVPGVSTLVARHGRVVHYEARGLMDAEGGKPVTPDTIYRIMSMTKPITCVALMMLYEEGRFLLTDLISKWLPSFQNMVVNRPGDITPPANRSITVRDCLTHTAGFSSLEFMRIRAKFDRPVLPDSPVPPVNTPTATCTVQQMVDELARVPLNSQPGTRWEYNPGHEVVAALVEVISGQSLAEFFQERILGPLQMVDTHFYLPKEKVHRFAAGYTVDMDHGGRFRLCDAPATSAKVLGPTTYCSGTGGLVSTAADYARFAQMLLNGGELDGVRLLGRKTIELMTTNHTGDLDVYLMGPGWGYGLGFCVRTSLSAYPALGTLGTYGWHGAYCTGYFADPHEDLFGLVFTQVRDFRQNPELLIREDFERMVYQALV